MKKNIKKVIFALFILGVVAGAGIMGIDYIVEKEADKYIVKADSVPKAEGIVVLGAYVFPDGRLCDMLKDRVDTAIELYGNKKGEKLLLSGDHGQKSYDEVNTMRTYAEATGIKSEDIFMDHAGFSTYESMYRAKDIFKVKKIIIVTQEYHLKRAVYMARRMGLEAYGVAADKQRYAGMDFYTKREILARCKDFFYVNVIKPKPTFLGESIPINGDGRVTHDKLKKQI